MADSRHLQASCLQLGFYLASWGMLRGSSVLLQRSMRTFIPVIQAISQMPSDSFPDPASDVLVTKTLLGVFGCVSAFDQYFRKGFAVSRLSGRSLEKVGMFYKEHAAVIEANRVPTISLTPDCLRTGGTHERR